MLISLLLLLVANGAPIIANLVLGRRWLRPVDNGFLCPDNRCLFGPTKTWRGLVAAPCCTALAGQFLGMAWYLGFWIGLLSMLGDLLSSFIKRRLGKLESSQVRGLDTLPESLLPLWFLRDQLGLGLMEIFSVAALFFLMEEFGSPILHQLHLRNRPY